MKIVRMTLKEFVETKQPKEQAIKMICAFASAEGKEINDTKAWEILSEYAGVTPDDFYDDREGAIKRYGKELIEYIDFKNWKYKHEKSDLTRNKL